MPQASQELDRVSVRLPRPLNLRIDAAVLKQRTISGRRITRSQLIIEILEQALAVRHAASGGVAATSN